MVFSWMFVEELMNCMMALFCLWIISSIMSLCILKFYIAKC